MSPPDLPLTKSPALTDAITSLSEKEDVRVIDTRQRKIRTWELVDLWRAGNRAYGGRLRVTGSAIVRPSGGGLYVQLTGGGRTLVRAWMPRGDSGLLADIRAEESVPDLTIEGEVKPASGAAVLLEFARVPQAGDPDEYTEYVLALGPRAVKPKEAKSASAVKVETEFDPKTEAGSITADTGGVSNWKPEGRPIGSFRLPGSGKKTVFVRGYTRKDGTFVRPHMRSPPRSGGRR